MLTDTLRPGTRLITRSGMRARVKRASGKGPCGEALYRLCYEGEKVGGFWLPAIMDKTKYTRDQLEKLGLREA